MIPAGLSTCNEFKHLAEAETNGFSNEIQASLNASVSLQRVEKRGKRQIKIAVPNGLGDGDTLEKQSFTFSENSYHNVGAGAISASRWLADNRGRLPGPVIPTLRRVFGLSTREAVRVIRASAGEA